ncbi:hypothetical protein FRC02_002157, partial [Tulasnella sp. 418]
MSSIRTERAPYRGSGTSLVISIDFGTTFSGSSWALLEPQQIPEVIDVSGYAGQEFQASSTKVPTVIYYDTSGEVRAAGGEIYDPEVSIQAREEGWERVEWFKLLLRPRAADDSLAGAPISPIPSGKTTIQVVGDYLNYMSKSAIEHFKNEMVGSENIWEKVKDKVNYVLSHPNGWDTTQHEDMRRAAIHGQLIPHTDEGRNRVHFVSEGEASLHWCVSNGVSKKGLQAGSDITVVDAGGGTIDVSSYTVTGTTPLKLKERCISDSHLAGSVFVTKAFEDFVRAKLEPASAYGDQETISHLVKEFDKTVKCVFRRKDRRSAVSFGSYRENEREFDIESGELIVQGQAQDMADFFEASCAAAADAVRKHASPTSRTIVFVVGGFAASPWLYSELQNRVQDLNVDIFRADTMTAKAAANGAIGYYLDRRVSARIAKWTYGVYMSPQFDPSDKEHALRLKDVHQDSASGRKFVDGGFHAHVTRGTAVQETQTTRFPLNLWLPNKQKKTLVTLELICYKGDLTDISWTDQDPYKFEELCSFTARIPQSALIPEPRPGTRSVCWLCAFDAVVSFGTTEFKCHIEWKDRQGVVHR